MYFEALLLPNDPVVADTRMDGWFMMESPLPTTVVCLVYVWLVKVAGPRFMKDRQPYQLKNLIIVYNFLQVLFSMFIFYEMPLPALLIINIT
ncbi:hypothetical protein HAZT_HAZT003532 [Hyalella azteca]|uniref:Elongation of very long chain fatty acids protein n=1 Tax=Hyalella azteca TaxID=294128 RepID=A0A6A0H2T4_HYAAZ|nr:hypothetical protein HAZT_HAZT003532 [Hyalella azteca]